MKVLNHDVCGAVKRMDRFVFELHKAVSSGLHHINEFDRVRFEKYLDAITQYHDWVVAQPQLDLPESHPTEYEVGEGHSFEDVESEDVNDLMRLWNLLRKEMVNSQSARMPSGLISFDSSRYMALVQKMRNFLSAYIDVVLPLDLPESSPKNPMSGPGRTGI